MNRSIRTATIAFAATVLVALSATAATLLPDDAGQATDVVAGLRICHLFSIGSLDH